MSTFFSQAVSSDSALAVTPDAVYVATRGLDGPTRLWRLDKLGTSEQLVVEGFPLGTSVAVVNDRVYLYSFSGNLWTGTDQGDFIDEGFPIRSVASSGGVVYADREGTLIARKEGEATWTPQPWLTSEAGLWPLDVSGQLCVLLRSWGGSQDHFELFHVQQPDSLDGDLRTLASGSGELVRLRSEAGAVYWLMREESGLLQLFRRHIRNGQLQVLATGSNLVDFALDASAVYLTRSLTLGYEIEVISTLGGIGGRPRLGTHLELRSPEADGEHLWFLEWDGLHRVELRAGEL
jgi:hypothetical protein